jgi:hypothetical protein
MTTLPVASVGYNTRKPQAPNVAAAYRWGTVWQSLRGWVLVMLLVQGLLGVWVDAKEQGLDHTAITLAVETALVNESGVPAHLIDVNTRDGVVTLSGWVDNLLAKERAGEIAESIKGVRRRQPDCHHDGPPRRGDSQGCTRSLTGRPGEREGGQGGHERADGRAAGEAP